MANPELNREIGRGPVGASGTSASPDNARISINTPGPTGHNDPFSPANSSAPSESGGLLDNLAELINWKYDTELLYATLIKEGLGFLAEGTGAALDVYSGSNKDGLSQFGEAWDKRFNNMGRAHNEYSRKHEFRAMLPFDKLAEWFAETDPMKGKFLQYYISCQGRDKDFPLTLSEMKLMPTFIDLFNPVRYSTNLKDLVEEAKKGGTVPVKTFVNGQNDALGNFGVHLDGFLKSATGAPTGPTSSPYLPVKLSPINPGVPLMFEGTMVWKDKWDFDTKMAARLKGPTGRGPFAELAVSAVAALVDGVNFDVTSSSVPMTQYSGRFPVY